MRLAKDIATCEALLRGEPVDPARIDPAQLRQAKQRNLVRLIPGHRFGVPPNFATGRIAVKPDMNRCADGLHFIPLPADIYFVAYLPFKVQTSDVVAVNAIAVLLSIVATWYPARTASRLDPIVAIREEG